jgi:RNA polymerase sigma-70 factor (ECF subfamily)
MTRSHPCQTRYKDNLQRDLGQARKYPRSPPRVRRGCVRSAAGADARRRKALRAALRSLGLEERELVLLRFLEEMSYAEMATIIGGTDASLRGKVFRALRNLRF